VLDGQLIFARAGGRGLGCARLWLVVGINAGVLGSGVGGRVNAGVLGSRVSGLSQCRVVVFGVSGLLRLANFFITISHCAWQHVISLSKATKKRSKENALTALP